MVLRAGNTAGCTEVQQLHTAAREHNVVRADVAVDNTLCMDPLQRAHHGQQQVKRLLHGQLAFTLQIGRKRLALEIFHDDVSRVVFFKKIAHIHDACLTGELRQTARFAQEALASLLEHCAIFALCCTFDLG